MGEAEYWPDGAFCRLTVGHRWVALQREKMVPRAFGAREWCSRCGTSRPPSMPRNSEATIKFRRPVISLRQYDQVPLSPEAFKCSPEPIRKELERKTMEQVRETHARLLAMGCVSIRVEPLPPPSVGFKLVGDKPVEVDGEGGAPEAEPSYSKVPLQTCEDCGFEARILYGSQWKCACGSVNPVE